VSFQLFGWSVFLAVWWPGVCCGDLWCYHTEGEPGLEEREFALQLCKGRVFYIFWERRKP
jgi:hypothetical protein